MQPLKHQQLAISEQMYNNLLQKTDAKAEHLKQLTLQQISANQQGTFGLYMQQQSVKNIDMPKYNPQHSLRTCIREFEEQAAHNGTINMNLLAPVIGRFLPGNMSKWMTHLPVVIHKN